MQLRLAAGTLDRPQLTEINSWLTQSVATSPAVPTPETLAPTIPPQGTPPPPPPPPTTPPTQPPGKR
jgi:hypothetical protein